MRCWTVAVRRVARCSAAAFSAEAACSALALACCVPRASAISASSTPEIALRTARAARRSAHGQQVVCHGPGADTVAVTKPGLRGVREVKADQDP